MFYGLITQDIRSLAYQHAERNGLTHCFSKDKKSAEKVWLKGFLELNSLSIWVPT